MRTAYSPTSHTELASASAGTPYGHVPGHRYSDVDVTISRARNGSIRVHVVESWGSAQGYDEEHGRREVVGRGPDISSACRDAESRAAKVGVDAGHLATAMSRAEDEAEEAAE